MTMYAIMHAPDAPLPETDVELIRELVSGYRELLGDAESLTLFMSRLGNLGPPSASRTLAEIARARAVLRLVEARFID